MRAYLIASPDGPVAMEAARGSEADALVLDARSAGGEIWASVADLRERSGMLLYARIGKISALDVECALSAAMSAQPDAIVVSARDGRDVARLGAHLAVQEAERGQPDGRTRIIALVADAEGALNVASLAGSSARLAAISWDARALAAELGSTLVDGTGSLVAPLAHVRGLVRLAAAAAGVEAIDDVSLGGGEAGFVDRLSDARAMGFRGILTEDPALILHLRQTR